jgi:hypothetical protein
MKRLLIVVFVCGLTTAAHAADSKSSQQEWERILEAARKEGQVAVYISGYEEGKN